MTPSIDSIFKRDYRAHLQHLTLAIDGVKSMANRWGHKSMGSELLMLRVGPIFL